MISVLPFHAFRSLRNYNFRLFWGGQLISQTGTWMQSVGQAWLVLDLSHSPLALGTVTALQTLPVLLFVLFAGVFVDRFPKRRLLLITQTTAMLQALLLAVLVSTGAVQLWHVYLLAFLLGAVNALDNPTRQSFVIEMVGREDLVNAVALNSMLMNSARIVGPAVGGLLIAWVGVAGCFYLNAGSFLAVLAGLLLMKPHLLRTSPRKPSGHVLGQLAEGLGYAVRTPTVFLIVILMGALGTFGYNFNTTLPLLARDALNADSAAFGALLSAMGVGSLIAALVVATAKEATVQRLFWGAAAFTVAIAAIAISRWYPVTLALMVPLGLASISFTTSANSRLQLTVPDALRGRVMSIYTLLFMGTTPIGGLFTGFLAEHLGIQWTLGIEASICGLGVAAGLLYYQRTRRAAPSSQPSSQSEALLIGPGEVADRLRSS